MNYHLIPNWRETVSESYDFATTVFTTHSGKEQRAAERALPRRSVTFETLLSGGLLQRAQALMHDRGAATISIPDPARYAAVLALPAAAGATTIVLESSPPWLAEGIALSLSDLTGSDFTTSGDIVNVGAFSVAYDDEAFDVNRRASITLTTPLTRAWGAGSAVRPVITGRLGQSVEFDFRAADLATVDIRIAVLPPTYAPELGAAALPTFDGRPLLTVAPNWSQAPSVTHTTPFEEVDYGRGVIRAFLPIEFYTRVSQFNYLGRSRETVGTLLDLFVQTRGRQGEFYSPSWTADMVQVGGVVSGSATLTVAGTTIASSYDGSAINVAVAIMLNDGTWLYRMIESITTTTEPGPGAFSTAYGEDFDGGESGSFSLITFTTPIAQDISERDIAMICWLNLCRFASDNLTIRWSNDDVARVSAQVMTLERLPAE